MISRLSCLLSLLAAMLLQPGPAAAQGNELKIGWQPAAFQEFFYASQEKMFEKAGLKPTLIKFTAGPPMLAALRSGDIDIAFGGLPPFIAGVSQGLDISIFFWSQIANASLIVQPDSKITSAKQLIGKKIVVLRFQASYCKPCGKEAAALNRLAERYRDRGVEVLAIHVQDTVNDTRSFVRAHALTLPVALDPRLSLGNRFGFKGTPYTVVIDRKGEIVTRLVGASAVTRLPRILDTLLKDAPPT